MTDESEHVSGEQPMAEPEPLPVADLVALVPVPPAAAVEHDPHRVPHRPARQTYTMFLATDLAAQGGAWAAILLGAWSVIGALVTPWSAINAVLGIGMAIWGFQSCQKRMAGIGLGLSGLGLVSSLGLLTALWRAWFG